jgi:REP-associated tyrosine transposase
LARAGHFVTVEVSSVTAFAPALVQPVFMPSGLHRRHDTWDLHFITFSCHQRRPFLANLRAKQLFEEALENSRRHYDFYVVGYVMMPEYVHLLISEPEHGTLASAIQSIKQSLTRNLRWTGHFWQARYYDFNVYTAEKRIEKLRYIHRNPVRRGFVERPEDWFWSSFEHYASGKEGVVEIESIWTARHRERMGITLKDTVHYSLP